MEGNQNIVNKLMNAQKVGEMSAEEMPVNSDPYYTIPVQGYEILMGNFQQLVEITNILKTAMSAEGKMAHPLLLQVAQNMQMASKMMKKVE